MAIEFSEANPNWWNSLKDALPFNAFENQPEELLGGLLIRQSVAGWFGAGYLAAMPIEDGFSLILLTLQPKESVAVTYPVNAAGNTFFISLFSTEKPTQLLPNAVKAVDCESEPESGVYLAENTGPPSRTFQPGVTTTHCVLSFSTHWFSGNISDEALLTKLRAKVGPGGITRPLSALYRTYLAQIENDIKHELLGALRLKADAYSLLTTALSTLLQEPTRAIATDEINKADLTVVVEIEKRITADLTGRPPTTADLSQEFGISKSKLKLIFHHVFGKGIFEYYQSHRMEKARELILSRTMTVSQAGRYVGYSNLSNFTLSFKKQFGYLPSSVHEAPAGA